MCRDHIYRAYLTLYQDGHKREQVTRTIRARTMRAARQVAQDVSVGILFDRAGASGLWTCKVTVGLV